MIHCWSAILGREESASSCCCQRRWSASAGDGSFSSLRLCFSLLMLGRRTGKKSPPLRTSQRLWTGPFRRDLSRCLFLHFERWFLIVP